MSWKEWKRTRGESSDKEKKERQSWKDNVIFLPSVSSSSFVGFLLQVLRTDKKWKKEYNTLSRTGNQKKTSYIKVSFICQGRKTGSRDDWFCCFVLFSLTMQNNVGHVLFSRWRRLRRQSYISISHSCSHDVLLVLFSAHKIHMCQSCHPMSFYLHSHHICNHNCFFSTCISQLYDKQRASSLCVTLHNAFVFVTKWEEWGRKCQEYHTMSLKE